MADTPPDSLPVSPASGGSGAHRIAQVTLDEATILWRNADVEQERRVAIYDLIEENTFKPLRSVERGAKGPFHLHLSVTDGRLAMDISDEAGQLLETLRQADRSAPFRAALKQANGGVGTAATEAPRGLLIHHYVVDEWGKVVAADIVTPTAINQRVMAAQIMADLTNEKDHERLCKVAERIVRAYDPCISCAVHLVKVENSSEKGLSCQKRSK